MIPNSLFIGTSLALGVIFGVVFIGSALEVIQEVAKKGCTDKDSEKWQNWKKHVTTRNVINWGLKGICIIALIALIVFIVTLMYADTSSKEINWSILTSTFTFLFLGLPFSKGIWEAYSQVKLHKSREGRNHNIKKGEED